MFTTIWRFTVRPERTEEFERHYGAEGTWAQFFRTGKGYIGTELHRSVADPGVYVTVDRWESEAAYDAFRKSRQREYEEIDRRFETLTLNEEHLAPS